MLNPYEELESQLRQLELRSSELLLQGDFEIAEEVANEYVAVAENASDQWQSWALLRLGAILENAGRYEEAAQHARAAQSLVPIDDPSWNQAAGLLGNIYFHQEDYSAAKEQYLHTIDRTSDSSFALCGLSSIEFDRGNFDKARQYALRAIKSARDVDDREFMSVAQNLLGDIELELGNRDIAEGHFRNALAICEELGRRRGISVACNRLSKIECERKNYVAGLDYGQRFVRAEIEMGRMEEVASNSYWIAFQLDNAEAPEVLQGGIKLCQTAFREATKPTERAWALRQQARFQEKLEQYDQAESSLKQAMEDIALSDPELAMTYGMLGSLQRERERFDAALESFAQALELAEKYQHVEVELKVHRSLAYCLVKKGKVVLASRHFQRALEIAELKKDQPAITHLQDCLEYFKPNCISRIRFWLLGRSRS